MAALALVIQLLLVQLLSWSEARVGHRLLEWTVAGGRHAYVLHLLAYGTTVPLALSQCAVPLLVHRPRLYWALGSLSTAQSVVLLVTGLFLVLRAAHLEPADQIYHSGTLLLMSAGVASVLALATSMSVLHRARGDLLMYRIWKIRTIGVTVGFLLQRAISVALYFFLPSLSVESQVCTAFGLSGIWAFAIVEYGFVTPMLRAQAGSR